METNSVYIESLRKNLSSLESWSTSVGGWQIKNPLNMPLDVALREAVQVAFALRRRWEPDKKLPGMSSLAGFSLSMADDLLSLVRAVQEAQFVCFLEDESEPPVDTSRQEEAKRLIDALRIPLEYLEDMLPPTQQAQIQKFRGLEEHKLHDEGSLYLLLNLYSTVASNSLDQLSQLGESFDPVWIEEAKQHMVALSNPPEPAALKSGRYAFYGLLVLLQEKVGVIRAAAGLVFRSHKKILKEFTSAHGRVQRRNAKKTKKEAKEK